MDQLDLGTCPGTQQGTWTHGRYTGSKFYFLRVDRTWVHLPGSQGRGPGYGRENFRGFFFFFLFSQHGPPALGNSTRFTGKGAWLRGREFSGIFFIPSKWTVCTWELYQVHREEVLETDEKIFGETFLFSQIGPTAHDRGLAPGTQRGPGTRGDGQGDEPGRSQS